MNFLKNIQTTHTSSFQNHFHCFCRKIRFQENFYSKKSSFVFQKLICLKNIFQKNVHRKFSEKIQKMQKPFFFLKKTLFFGIISKQFSYQKNLVSDPLGKKFPKKFLKFFFLKKFKNKFQKCFEYVFQNMLSEKNVVKKCEKNALVRILFLFRIKKFCLNIVFQKIPKIFFQIHFRKNSQKNDFKKILLPKIFKKRFLLNKKYFPKLKF